MVKFPVGTRVKAKYLATKLGPFAAVQYKEGAITKVLAELKEGKPVVRLEGGDDFDVSIRGSRPGAQTSGVPSRLCRLPISPISPPL